MAALRALTVVFVVVVVVVVGVSAAGASTGVDVATVSVEDVVVVTDSDSAAVAVGVAVSVMTLVAGSARLVVVDDRTVTDEPLLDSGADFLLVERLRAGPAFLAPWLEFEE